MAPHSAKVGEKGEHVRIAHDCAIEVQDHRQRQARTLRKSPKSPHVDEGGNAWRRAAKDLALGDRQALPEFGQQPPPIIAAIRRPSPFSVRRI